MAVTSVDWSVINGQSLLASCSDDQVKKLLYSHTCISSLWHITVIIDGQVIQWGNIRTTAGVISSWVDTWLVYSDLPQVL